MIRIPNALRDPNFRFFLAGKDSKVPCEKKWNTENCYAWNDERLKSWDGNVGIVTGIGNLIVIDFDSKEFYKMINPEKRMPWTFCVKTPGKELYHLYYYLEGDMFSKTPIKDKEDNTLCDIQAAGAGIICPPSKINGKRYKVVTDVPIQKITLEQLQVQFDFEPVKKREWKPRQCLTDKTQCNNESFIITKESLRSLGIKQMTGYKFECPFHTMHGNGNLAVFQDGALKCFDCGKYWSNANYFMQDYYKFKNTTPERKP